MRLSLVAAGLIFSTVFFVAGGSPAHAQSQNNQTAQPKVVQVQPGDYLAKIASQNNTTYPRLYAANINIKDPDIIFPGESLRIPTPEEQLESRPLPEEPLTPPKAVQPSAQAPAAKAAPRAATPARRPASPSPAPAAINNSDGDVWDRLAQCESGGNWAINTGNGYYGGLQFSLASWRGVGGNGYPHQASRAEQISRAEALRARQGWGAWPACSSKLGLR